VLLILCTVMWSVVFAQTPPAEPVLVVEGGTLIDGNGGAPLPDSSIVIRGNRIASVSRRGRDAYPPNAQIINAAGQFVSLACSIRRPPTSGTSPSRSSTTA
jgi:hypothetical protein